MTWRLLAGPSSGAAPTTEVDEFGGVTWKWPVTGGETLGFSVPGQSRVALALSGYTTDLWLYEDTTLRQRFRTLPLAQDWDEDGGDSITVQAVSYAKLLAWRHLHADLAWTDTDQGTIIWEAIEHTQALPGGDLGITAGDITTGIERQRTWAEGENIGKLFQDLERVINGPVWRIDGARVLTVDGPAGMGSHSQPLQHGVNARRLTRRPADRFANSARYVGSTEQTTPVWFDDPGIALDPRGRFETTGGNNSVVLQTTVQQHAEGMVEEGMRPPGTWTAALEPGRWRSDSRYEPGMFITIVQPASTADPVGAPAALVAAQVTELTVGFDQDGAETITLTAVEV